jgi:hypothetical protein
MLQYCTVAGCQRKCKQAFCFLHDQGNRNALYSCESRLLAYCGPAELEKLAPYFPLQEASAVWRRFPGDTTAATWRDYHLRIHDDGTLEGEPLAIRVLASKGKFRSISTNDADIVVLAEDYSFYWYNASRDTIQHYSLAPQRIVQVALQRDRLVYLTDRMELFSYTFQGQVQPLFSEHGVRLFYVHPAYANVFYVTSQHELYNDYDYLGCEMYRRFTGLSGDLELYLRDGTKHSYAVSTRSPIGPTGILL